MLNFIKSLFKRDTLMYLDFFPPNTKINITAEYPDGEKRSVDIKTNEVWLKLKSYRKRV